MGFIAYLLETMYQGNQKAFLNIDINVLFKTLILKLKQTIFLFFFKNLQHFLYHSKKVLRFQ
jgi:riboflavin transporter FmnP